MHFATTKQNMMTKTEVVQEFNELIKPHVLEIYGRQDKVAMSEAWNEYTDFLCKEGLISTKQYENWDNPFHK